MTLNLFGRPSLFSLRLSLSFFWIFYTFFFLHPSLTCPSPSTCPLMLVLCEKNFPIFPSAHTYLLHFLPASSSTDEPHLPLSIRSQFYFDPQILLSRYLPSIVLFQFFIPLIHSHQLGKLMKSPILNKLFIGPMSLSEYCFISLLPDDIGTGFFFFFLLVLSFFINFLKFYFIFKLYNIVLVLPNIEMNPPQVYMCSPSWTLLPPPSPYHPSGSSQCTSPKHQYLASNLDWWLVSYTIFYMFQCHSPKSSHPLPLVYTLGHSFKAVLRVTPSKLLVLCEVTDDFSFL